MPKFIGVHTFSPGAFKMDQIKQMAKAAQEDPVVKGYRSFLSLKEGKMICVFDAPSKEALIAWFKKMNIPYDSVTRAEYEGERGVIKEI